MKPILVQYQVLCKLNFGIRKIVYPQCNLLYHITYMKSITLLDGLLAARANNLHCACTPHRRCIYNYVHLESLNPLI